MASSADITFYSQEKASVFIESTEPRASRAELRIFVHYVVRQYANFGTRDGTTAQLGYVMNAIGYEPGDETVRRVTDGVDVVPAQRAKGRKGFDISLSDAGHVVVKPYGFGIIGRGIGYYAPVSVLVLVKHLWAERHDDTAFVNGLIFAAVQLATIGGIGTATPTNQDAIAESVLGQALPIYDRHA